MTPDEEWDRMRRSAELALMHADELSELQVKVLKARALGRWGVAVPASSGVDKDDLLEAEGYLQDIGALDGRRRATPYGWAVLGLAMMIDGMGAERWRPTGTASSWRH